MIGQYRTKNPPRRERQTGVSFDMGSALQALKDVALLKRKLESEVRVFLTKANAELARFQRIQRGLPGKDGVTPVKGVHYRDGRDGKDGKNGRDGRAGKDANGVEIQKNIMAAVRKLHEGLVEKVTNAAITAVKAYVEETVRTLRTEMRSASSKMVMGGGMGTIKYFQFTGDGVTTSFQLPDQPTQDGNAVFAFQNGARLHPTDHYTVGGSANRTFTPVNLLGNGEIIDGWIIT